MITAVTSALTLLALCQLLTFTHAQANAPAPAQAVPVCANTDGSVANDGACMCKGVGGNDDYSPTTARGRAEAASNSNSRIRTG